MSIDSARLERTLNPRTIVVVGDKGPNYNWLNNQKGFTGNLYSVQVDAKEVSGIVERGFTNFARLADVPGPIDLVICVVPRQVTPRIIADAAALNVGGVAMFTAGFAETKEATGIELQQQIVEIATSAGMAIVGPNCMGVYNRQLGVRFSAEMEYGDRGNVSFISQSGSMAMALTSESQKAGLKIGRAISSGNACVVNEADYLEYLAGDPDTEYIGLYLEGVQEGQRFFRVLREATRRKPVVIFKGGSTEPGARATDSHTGAMGTPHRVWEAMVRQAGAVPVVTRDELIDTLQALVHAPAGFGHRMALIAGSGGNSVAIGDAAGRAGLDAAVLSDDSNAKLGEFFNIIGGTFANPFDVGFTIGNARSADNLPRILDILGTDPSVDGVLYDFGTGSIHHVANEEAFERILGRLDTFVQQYQKPVMFTCDPRNNAKTYEAARNGLIARGFPVFTSFDRAAHAYARATEYWTNRRGRESERWAATS